MFFFFQALYGCLLIKDVCICITWLTHIFITDPIRSGEDSGISRPITSRLSERRLSINDWKKKKQTLMTARKGGRTGALLKKSKRKARQRLIWRSEVVTSASSPLFEEEDERTAAERCPLPQRLSDFQQACGEGLHALIEAFICEGR